MERSRQQDLTLARRAAEGDARAWEELVGLHGQTIYNLTLRFARHPAEAEDLTQEIFLKLYRRLDRYRGDVPLLAWTLRLSRNLCIEHYRRRRRERATAQVPPETLAERPGGDDPQAAALRRQRLRLVHRGLAEMSEDLALAVTLRDLQGLSYEEAAAFLEVPMGTLKSRLVRGRRELAERVDRLVAPGKGAGPATPLTRVESC